jgi:hypothetical protein
MKILERDVVTEEKLDDIGTGLGTRERSREVLGLLILVWTKKRADVGTKLFKLRPYRRSAYCS